MVFPVVFRSQRSITQLQFEQPGLRVVGGMESVYV